MGMGSLRFARTARECGRSLAGDTSMLNHAIQELQSLGNPLTAI